MGSNLPRVFGGRWLPALQGGFAGRDPPRAGWGAALGLATARALFLPKRSSTAA